jgi:hypothetical protein
MEIRNNPLQSDITRPIREGIKERVEALPRESDRTDRVTDRVRKQAGETDQAPKARDTFRQGGETDKAPAKEPLEPTSIQKRGRNARLKIKHELFEKRIHSARQRVTERARARGHNYRKSLEQADKTTHTNGPDKAVLSDKAASLSKEHDVTDKLTDIKRAFHDGTLNTRDLIARTAFKMLDGK